MNNIEELERMKDDIQNIKEKYIPGLEKKIDSLSYSTDARKINQLASKKLTLKGLEINDKKGNVSFQKCYEVLVRKKRGINTIAICALVTLYELELKEVFPRLKFEIRYNLRAFWKMDRAIKLLEGFLGLQDRLLGIMQNEMYYLKRLKKNAEPVELQNIINQ